MTRARAALLLTLLPVALAAIVLRAEGPLYVGGPPLSTDFPNGNPNSVPGQPYRWVTTHTPFPLTYWTDQGSLGALPKTGTSGADALVQNAFQTWQDIPTASISFTKAGDLGANVTASNALAVQDALYDCSTLPGDPAGGIAKPRTVIYDDSAGSIIIALGEDPNSILGFADTPCLESDGTNNYFTRGYAVLNGKFTDTAQDRLDLQAVMIHEFGHMIGLDHSQINVECYTNFFGCSADELAGLPTMFPYLIDGTAMSTPATDDIAGLSELYPETVNNPPNQVPFASTTGHLIGHVFFSDGVTPAQGFNVVVRQVDNPATMQDESKIIAVSNTSGALFTADEGNVLVPVPGFSPNPFGSQDTALIGTFDIPGLPPGDYTVEVEALNPDFVLGSGAGPIGSYLGFEFPMPGSCTTQFWNNSGSTVCDNSTPITVTAGGPPIEVNITLIGTPPRYDAWEDGP
jgi:hypothetical protein